MCNTGRIFDVDEHSVSFQGNRKAIIVLLQTQTVESLDHQAEVGSLEVAEIPALMICQS